MAHVDGISLQGIIGSATIWSTVIAGVVASVYVFRLVKRKRTPQRTNPHQSPSQQDTEEEAMNAADFSRAAMMIGGAGFGFLIGLALFAETYALIASSIVGGIAGPIIAKWLDRRM
ncbi:MAG: hypothetical protein F4171_08675, partial [Gammaproteobacteria bacterium]|nr:hypothetical protein [Gammaproteobacteria bacterium]